MNHSTPGAALVIGSLMVGATLHLLRQAIDRHRGLLAEVVAVGLPLVMACGFVVLTEERPVTTREIGSRLAPLVELVFISLPMMMVCRVVERLQVGGQLQIADLFRLTTAAAIAVFALNSLNNTAAFIDIFIVTVIFLAAEFSSRSRHRHRNMASVFSLGLISCIFLNIFFGRSVVAFFGFDELLSTGPGHGMLGLITCLGLLVTTPLWMRWTIQHATVLRQLALAMASWRLATVKPSAAIRLQPVLNLWHFSDQVCYLNHGSFGAVPLLLRQTQHKIRAECDDEPLDFLARHLENRWLDARQQLAAWLGAQAENVAFCENATAAMNEIAHWFPLSAGDEVLINDHEYGAVKRIWQRKCREAGANLVTATLPLPLVDAQQIIDTILDSVTPRTKLVILSHVTSPTAILLPVNRLCALLKKRNIPTCIDGPHALLQQPLKLHTLECDFYTASCHKWLCAPLGSGFVYATVQWHEQFVTSRLSWGRLEPGRPKNWSDELLWTGTRDYSAYLTVPHAIRFFQAFDATRLDERNHKLACFAREQLSKLAGAEPVTPEGREWFGWMVAVWLPPGDHSTLQQRLWRGYRIEVPIVRFAERWLVRVSCHLYNTTADIERLVHALTKEL